MHLADESRGRFLGLAFNDEVSGDTTLNAGIVTFVRKMVEKCNVSLRYSVSLSI